jgi:hypothetical protein
MLLTTFGMALNDFFKNQQIHTTSLSTVADCKWGAPQK